MKKIYNLCLLALSLVVISSCDDGFDALNTSKVAATTNDPVVMLNSSIISSSPAGLNPGSATSTLSYESALVQQIVASNGGVIAGGNWNQKNIGNTPLNWINYYQNVIRFTNDVISRTKTDANRTNLYNMARIIQAHAFMILTDTYGDIPYTEAGGAYTTSNFFPKYDTQQSIYDGIISELTQAVTNLDASAKVELSDVLYKGNITNWKKFGNSLLLRAGMRLSKANATKAQATVAIALTAPGVILVNADNAFVAHDGNFSNGIAATVTGTEYATYYLAQPFVDALKNSNDPRLTSIAIRYVGAASGSDQNTAIATPTATLYTDKTAGAQYGMPVGSDDNSATTAAALLPGGGKYQAFSQMDRNRFIKKGTPGYLVTAAQCNLLLAEATFRGWATGTAAATYFTAGITAHMNQMASYDPNSAISATAISNYVTDPANMLTAGTELQQIGYQYWIASFLDGPEAYASFRRTGFPALAPNPYPGSEVKISDGFDGFVYRLTYPSSEIAVNPANVQAAIAAQGPDNLATKMWLFK